MQNPGVLWFMIKKWQIGDQIQDHNIGVTSVSSRSFSQRPREAPRSRPRIVPSGVLENWKVLAPIYVKVRMEMPRNVALMFIPPAKIAANPN